jgi:hypothetical protein
MVLSKKKDFPVVVLVLVTDTLHAYAAIMMEELVSGARNRRALGGRPFK